MKVTTHNADTHTLVLIFPADVIREVDERRAGTGKSRVDILAEAIKATNRNLTTPRRD